MSKIPEQLPIQTRSLGDMLMTLPDGYCDHIVYEVVGGYRTGVYHHTKKDRLILSKELNYDELDDVSSPKVSGYPDGHSYRVQIPTDCPDGCKKKFENANEILLLLIDESQFDELSNSMILLYPPSECINMIDDYLLMYHKEESVIGDIFNNNKAGWVLSKVNYEIEI